MPVVRYQLRHRAEGQRLGEPKVPILMVDPDEFVGAIVPEGISRSTFYKCNAISTCRSHPLVKCQQIISGNLRSCNIVENIL